MSNELVIIGDLSPKTATPSRGRTVEAIPAKPTTLAQSDYSWFSRGRWSCTPSHREPGTVRDARDGLGLTWCGTRLPKAARCQRQYRTASEFMPWEKSYPRPLFWTGRCAASMPIADSVQPCGQSPSLSETTSTGDRVCETCRAVFNSSIVVSTFSLQAHLQPDRPRNKARKRRRTPCGASQNAR
jgi:hypothetical protein